MSQKDQPKTIGMRIGEVTADGRDKTIKVVLNFRVMHRKYGKYVRKRTCLHVHDERGEARVGDRVQIAPSRPVSKTKRWRLVRVLEREGATVAEPVGGGRQPAQEAPQDG